ncbi:MAG TPA: hypothetical protein VIK14_16955 [Ignavibacteria bacterium]
MNSLNSKIEENPPLYPLKGYDKDGYDLSLVPDFINNSEIETLPDPEITYKSCPNHSASFYFQNTTTGKSIPLSCNKYSCPYCGRIKARKLYAGMFKYFQQFEYIRFWTITLSSTHCRHPLKHYEFLQEIWRRFIIEIRRNKYFSKKERAFQYVRVSEFHEGEHGKFLEINNNGYIHFHVLATEYLEVTILQKLLNHITEEVMLVPGKQANIKMKGFKGHKDAAHYVTKYVMKSAKQLEKYQKKWTKSGKTALFEKKIPSGDWILLNRNMDLAVYFAPVMASLNYNLVSFKSTSQNYDGLSPPKMFISEISGINTRAFQEFYECCN